MKICGITRAEDARAAVAAGADALGLVFYAPSPRAVTPEQAVSALADVSPFVTVTALFVNPDPSLVEEVLAKVKPDLLQFHGDETEEFCQQFGRPYIKAIRVRPETDLATELRRFESAKGVLLDAYRPGVPGGTGEAFDWSLISPSMAPDIILAGGLSPANVGQAIAQVRPYAVDVSGGVEAHKGVKDHALLQQFFDEVCCADNSRSE
ncbi:phosphoribosylanthranilate isomerase [Motiliproteus sediminis]|uniref:phosphoribosylanthranilate isomerase n=1 Tax=Motiliproteus sediminis TaxID=1468178 RepID=UPI003CCE8453